MPYCTSSMPQCISKMPQSPFDVPWGIFNVDQGIFEVERGIFEVQWGIDDVQQGIDDVNQARSRRWLATSAAWQPGGRRSARPLQETGMGKETYRNAATVARVLFSTRALSLPEAVPMGWPL